MALPSTQIPRSQNSKRAMRALPAAKILPASDEHASSRVTRNEMSSVATTAAPQRLTFLARVAPGLQRLRTYQRAWLRPDVIAGLTLAAYLMPAGLADSSLANLPPQAGLYACLFS